MRILAASWSLFVQTGRALVSLTERTTHDIRREPGKNALTCGKAEISPQIRIARESAEGCRQCRNVAGWHNQSLMTVPHEVPTPRHVGNDQGPARGGRFQHCFRHALP